MNILILNSGSSSIKYQLFDIEAGGIIAAGTVERIATPEAVLYGRSIEKQFIRHVAVSGHRAGLELILQILQDDEVGIIDSTETIKVIGHRVVHGGREFTQSILIDEEILVKLESCNALAPLHNPHNLLGIRESIRLLPGIPNVAVFDTTFHLNMPERAALYALPYEFFETREIRRFGFHGTSYRYVTREAANFFGQPLESLNMIVCHLGNGCSITAVEAGQSIDTSMGFTPLEGLMMGTRSGDVDPGIIIFLQRQFGLTEVQIDDLLNRKSGLLGISGVSNDLRDICAQAEQGHKRCQLALEMFAYRVKKYIGAYAASLGGLDLLVFTAGIGENSAKIRAMICAGMDFMGIQLDEGHNQNLESGNRLISKSNSAVSVLVIPTHEEKIIVEDALTILRGNQTYS